MTNETQTEKDRIIKEDKARRDQACRDELAKFRQDSINCVCRNLQSYAKFDVYLDVPDLVPDSKECTSSRDKWKDKKGNEYEISHIGVDISLLGQAVYKRVVKLIRPDGLAPNPDVKIGEEPSCYRDARTHYISRPKEGIEKSLDYYEYIRIVGETQKRRLDSRLQLTTEEVDDFYKESFETNQGNLAKTLFIPNQKGLLKILASGVPDNSDSFLINPNGNGYQVDFFDLRDFTTYDDTPLFV